MGRPFDAIPRPALPEADLVLAHGTLRDLPIDERVAVAAAAGYAGIGLAARGYAAALAAGWTDSSLRSLLADHGVGLMETEGPFGFAPGGTVRSGPLAGRRYGDPAIEARVFHMADAFGVRHVNVGAVLDGDPGPGAADDFGALCDRAAPYGLQVALEPLPCSTVPDLRTALDLVTAADRPNGGLCLDSWHYYRGDPDDEVLREVPPERVVVVQLDDGPLEPVLPDYLEDTLHHRTVPGAGEFPLDRFLGLLHSLGVRAPVSVEVLSDELDALPRQAAAERAAQATRQVLRALLPGPTAPR